MKTPARCMRVLATGTLAIALMWSPAMAQNSRIVDGLVLNLGIVPAEVALRADGHRDAHPANPPSGSQHLLITVDDRNSGKRISDAEVSVEVTDPKGHAEKKPMLHTQGGGLPDYSELFRFGWPGEYSIRVIIARPSAKPIETVLKVHHAI